MINKKEVFKNLISYLQNPDFSLKVFLDFINDYKKDGFDINSKYLKGKTIAHYIVKYNRTGVLNSLYQMGLNVNICDDSYDAPIHSAIKYHYVVMVSELLACGADINMGSEFDQTPLHKAVAERDDTMVEFLLKKGADSLLVDENNNTALQYAIDDNNSDIINIFEKYKRRKKS